MQNNYLSLEKLEAYQLSIKLSAVVWRIYEKLDWHDKKIMGDQFIESTDSTEANIAEGYGRFHYLDKVKFYYNARGSLLESRHWFNQLNTRGKIANDKEKHEYLKYYSNVRPKLNGLIKSTMNARNR